MEAKELKRSRRAFQLETRLIWGCALLTAILAAIIMRLIINMAIGTYLLSGVFTFVIVMFFAWAAIQTRSNKWHKTKYLLGQDSIIVTQPNGMFGVTQDVYLYESILSISFQQDYFGKKYGYGDIDISIPKLGKTLVLKSVVEPSKQLPHLKAQIQQKADRPRALVT
jgi:hypothetical protein